MRVRILALLTRSQAAEATQAVGPDLPQEALGRTTATTEALVLPKKSLGTRTTTEVVTPEGVSLVSAATLHEVLVTQATELEAPARSLPAPKQRLPELPADASEIKIIGSEQSVPSSDILDTFAQLIRLSVSKREEGSVTKDPSIAPVIAESAETSEPNRFEILVSTLGDSRETPTIESIREVADEQPLEETFNQLAMIYISKKIEGVEVSEEAVIIEQLIQEIGEALEQELNTLEKPQLTPEITQKLVQLLDVLGYQKPHEVLVQFVEKYDLEMLMDSVKYLYQLKNDENRPEFLSPSLGTVIITNDGESVTQRIGRAIFSLVNIRLPTVSSPS